MKRSWLLLMVAILSLWPISVLAQDVDITSSDDILIRINGAVNVPAGQTIDSVGGISNDVTIDGTVNDALVVIHGNAQVNGAVNGSIVVIDGALTLGPQSTVKDVYLFSSDLTREQGSTVTGTIETKSTYFTISWWDRLLLTFFVWSAFTVFFITAGLTIALLARKVLAQIAMTATEEVGPSLVTGLVAWIALPIVGVLSFFTIIGIFTGFAILGLILPLLWLLGYIVISARLGLEIFRALSKGERSADRIVWATLVGILIFQLIFLIPVVGSTVVFLAGLLGSGALIYRCIRAGRDSSSRVTPPVPAS